MKCGDLLRPNSDVVAWKIGNDTVVMTDALSENEPLILCQINTNFDTNVSYATVLSRFGICEINVKFIDQSL